MVDISFWISGELSINLNSNGKINAFQILPETKNDYLKYHEELIFKELVKQNLLLLKI